ncbi:MAG: autotransporter-associated beta strand repeat-containing protein [Verrucomicrobia bacterium]|nr:autotransporter-associated beta strand repeat-containing protein [Verrucomicrobiota bacterium]
MEKCQLNRYVSLFLLTQCGLFAATDTWQGTTPATNCPMNVAGNWSGNAVPSNGDNLIFPLASSHTPTLSTNVLNNIGTLTVGSLTISDAYTISGSNFTIASTQTLTYGASNSNIQVGGITLNSGATWQISSNTPGNTITSAITGPGNLNLTGGLLILKGLNNYTGTTTLGTGANLQAQSASAFGSLSNVTLSDGSFLNLNNNLITIGTLSGTAASTVQLGTGNLTITNSGTITYPGSITGTNGGVTLAGSGSLTLSGNNTFSSMAAPGTVSVTAGTLVAGSVNAFGTYTNVSVASGATLDINGNNLTFGTLTGAGTLTLGAGTVTVSQGNSGTFSGVVGPGAGGFTLTSGTLSLTNISNSYTGATTLQGGSNLQVNGFGTTSGITFISGGGTVTTLMPITSSIPITLTDVGGFNTNGNAVTLNGTISGPGATFTKSGTGTLTLGGGNNYIGGTAVTAGTLQAGSSSAFGTNSDITVSTGATLALNNNSVSVGGLAGNTGSFCTLGTGTLTVTAGTINPFYGQISGTGGNIALTGGSLTLMGANNYTGTTTLSGGTTLNMLSFGSTSSLVFGTGGGNIEIGSDTTTTASLVINGPAIIGTNTFDASISGSITGNGSVFSKLGQGTLTLTGSNGNAGPIQIEGGVLNLTPTSLGSTTAITFTTFGGTFQAGAPFTGGSAINIPFTLTTEGTIDTNGNAVSVSSYFTGGNNLVKAGAGTLTLTGGNNYNGLTIIENGTLSVAPDAYSPNTLQLVFRDTGNGIFQAGNTYNTFPSSVVFMSSGTIDTNGFAMTIDKVIASDLTSATPPTFTKVGTNTLTLSGANIYTAATVVNAGTLQAGVASVTTSPPSGAFGVGSAVTVASGATLSLNNFSNSIGSLAGAGSVSLGTGTLTIGNGNSQTFSGVISGSGGVTLTSGTQTFSGLNIYSGGTTINGGTLTAGVATTSSNGAFGNNSAVTIASGGTLALGTFNNTIGSLSGVSGSFINLGSGILTISNGGSQTFSGIISGSGGGLTLTTGNLTLGGLNTYTGPTQINGGTLTAGVATTGSNGAFGNGSAVTLASGGTLALGSFNNRIGSLTGPSGSFVNLGSGTLTIANGGGNTFSGVISGSGGGLTLTTGNFTLNGLNTYTGATTINGGTLTAGVATSGSAGPFGNGSAVTVASGGTAAFQTFNTTVGSLTNSGTVTSSATITSGSYTQNTGSFLTLNVPTNAASPLGNIATTGGITLNGGTLTVTNTGGFTPTASTELILLQSSGTGKQLNGSFTTTNVSAFTNASISYDYSENKVILGFASSSCNNGNWIGTSSGNWGDSVSGPNWSGGCAPGTSGLASDAAVADMNTVSASSITVTLANAAGSAPQSLVLHDLNFNSSSTSYTIQQFSSMGTITLDAAPSASKPKITITAGDHTINAPIILNKDSRFSLNSGSLTLGPNSGITSTSTWNLSEGSGTGTLNNYATLTPGSINVEGNTLNNHGTINPTGTITISGLGGNIGSAIVNNYSTMTSGGAFTIGGGAGPTTVTNQGTMSSAAVSGFSINSGTVTNNGQMFAGSGGSLTIAGGTVTNSSGATLGSSSSNIIYTNGTLTSSGPILALDYLQAPNTELNLNVSSTTSLGSITASGIANIGGTLNVTALPDFSMTDGQTVNLVSGQQLLGQFDNNSAFINFPNTVIPSLVYTSTAVQLDIREVVHAHASATTQTSFSNVSQHNLFITTRKCYQIQSRFSLPSKASTTARNETVSKNRLVASNNSMAASEDAEILGQSPVIREKQQQLIEKVSGERPVAKPWSVYAGPTGGFGHVNAQGNQAGFGYHSEGALGGFDYAFPDENERQYYLGLGVVGDYQRSSDNQLFTSDVINGSLYGTVVPKMNPDIAIDGILGVGYNWTTTYRSAGIGATAIGKPRTLLYNVFFDFEYTFSDRSYSMPKDFHVVPLASLQFVQANVSSYTETGAGIYDLHVSSQKINSLTSILGTRVNYTWRTGNFSLRTEVDGGWQHEFLNYDHTVYFTAFNFTTIPTPSTAFGAARNSWLVGLDLLGTAYNSFQFEANASYIQNENSYNAFFYFGIGGQF